MRRLNPFSPMFVFKYTKYPNAAKEYLRFMMERSQYEAWQSASLGYVQQHSRLRRYACGRSIRTVAVPATCRG